jgi:hypothetical protein
MFVFSKFLYFLQEIDKKLGKNVEKLQVFDKNWQKISKK